MDKKTLDNKEMEKTAGGTGISEIPLPPLDDPEYRELIKQLGLPPYGLPDPENTIIGKPRNPNSSRVLR